MVGTPFLIAHRNPKAISHKSVKPTALHYYNKGQVLFLILKAVAFLKTYLLPKNA